MALVKLSQGIIRIRGRCGGVYFKHDKFGQHVQRFPRQVRSLLRTQGDGGHSGRISQFSSAGMIWLLALVTYFAASWAAYALVYFFIDKDGKRKKISGFNWYMYYAMKFPEEQRPPLWMPPHSPGELPSYLVSYKGWWTYEHNPTEWPGESCSGYFWPGPEYDGKPTYHTDDNQWWVWWYETVWCISDNPGEITPDMTFFSTDPGIKGQYQNPDTGSVATLYIGGGDI